MHVFIAPCLGVENLLPDSSVHLAIKSGAGIAPLLAVYATQHNELVCVPGPLSELNYPMFLLAHRDLRTVPRMSAVSEFA
jgi:hypothetical protein